MKCKQCGSEIKPGYKFCEECGAPVPQQVKAKPSDQAKPPKQKKDKSAQTGTQPVKAKQEKAQPAPAPAAVDPTAAPKPAAILISDPDEMRGSYAGSGAVRKGIPAPGYSDRVNDREILKASRKHRIAARVFACIIIPLPLIGFIIYSLVSQQMELGQAALYGGIISGVFLFCYFLSLLKSILKKPYEATVTDMKSRLKYKHRGDDNEQCYTEYITYVVTTDGKKKKIKEREGAAVQAYFYLEIGDRFLYHPQFSFPYEVYDKSKKRHLYCVCCRTKNPVENDRCSKCGVPLLK